MITDNPYAGMFSYPARTLGLMSGAAFGSSIREVPLGPARETAIQQQFELGNVPEFMRTGLAVAVRHKDHEGVFWAAPDYLCVGQDWDYLRVPINPLTAQRILAGWGAVLPTRKMVNEIWKAATIKLAPHPMPPTAAMTSTDYFMQHNDTIQAQLKMRRLGDLVAGHKKDVVVSRTLRKGRVAIYGWHQLDGAPIQGPGIQDSFHEVTYADYSHGIRPIAEEMLVDGTFMPISFVLKDPELCGLVSDEGVFTKTKYEE